MKLINQISLARGATLLEYAFSNRGQGLVLETADLIGIVAGYIARGHLTAELEDQLSGLLSPQIAADARRTFEVFDDPYGRGLWSQGPAMDDITFTDSKLKHLFPIAGEGSTYRGAGLARTSF